MKKSLLIKMVPLFLLFFILILAGCIEKSNDPNKIAVSSMKYNKVANHFAIFLVKGEQAGNAMNTKLEELRLETQPVLTDKDLKVYKWKEHELELRKDFDLYEVLDYVPLSGLPFVVVANDERVYLGAFWSPLSSQTSSIPSVMVLPMSPQNTIHIISGYPGKTTNSQSDPRGNQKIYDALKSVGKIKE
ncbi:hypothetical protein ACPUYX_07275 [Desulfosporosinus sp. SYSU MS00001]|uniref:hypothetical protein n=1 Tax=Desulfosporosinus sp. SYSU MS00001 TaxID=3416284 RepID=UPI003CF1F6AF